LLTLKLVQSDLVWLASRLMELVVLV